MKLSLRTKYLFYIIAIHAALIFLIFKWLQENKLLFIVSEVLVLASVLAAIQIYRAFGQPSQFISAGIEAIKDKDFTIKFVPTGNREVDGLIDVYNLMIDQLREERTKQMEQQFFLEKLIEASPIATLIFDFDRRISSANPKATALLQRPANQLTGRYLSDIDHPLLNQLAQSNDNETRTLKGTGIETYRIQRSHFMDRGFRRDFILIEELTSEILESEKKAYSKVIRMMAHEVNNSIGAINSILNVTKSYMDAPDQEDVSHALQIAIERNDRLNLFMRRFADVVRLPQPHKNPTDLNEMVHNVSRLMHPQAAARGVVLHHALPPDSVWVPVDVVQLEQVLVNVIKNAIEACVAGQTVDILVTPEHLIIRDNGLPISPDLETNLFNPFFSTKPDGQGIGLTLTRDILLNHGFPFSLKTNPDGWTEFTILFGK
ncbi:sensor histidine kinase [Larkinella punicea]|uniref:histidine kinase n=1 Tax=Larkinella punicea TaxID=2315727 RepID=A0A368JSR4_9BACT|nr:ATP-binding protein [Larkinella punicea]RCR70006.1 histidine kinase [Larkinella punicea]